MSNDDLIEKRVRLSYLFDFYGPLIKENHREIFELYIMEDYGLSEIAKLKDKSRQSVFETIKRVSAQLISYEEKLGLVEKFEEEKKIITEIAEEIKEAAERKSEIDSKRILDKLNEILED